MTSKRFLLAMFALVIAIFMTRAPAAPIAGTNSKSFGVHALRQQKRAQGLPDSVRIARLVRERKTKS